MASGATDVLIVGAGPVGLALANELVRYGLSVRIVDKNSARTDKSKALVVWSRTLELIQRMGIADTFVEAGLKVRGAAIWAGKREIGEIDLTNADTPYPFGLMIPQSETERLLEQNLARLGVHVDRLTEVVRLNEGSTTLVAASGAKEEHESKWVVGCDGAHSVVRHQLGFEFRGSALLDDWVLADVHITGLPSDIVILYWHTDGVLAFFPLSTNRYRMIADLGVSQDSANPRSDPTLEQVQSLIDERGPGGIVATDPVWISLFHINERIVDNYRSGRIFLAGDAAHVHSPAGGQGMNTGIQDACNLAWKLALAQRGESVSPVNAEGLLNSYSHERRAIGKLVVDLTGRATKLVMLSEPWQGLRNTLASILFGFTRFKELASSAASELAVSYHDSPLSVTKLHHHGLPRAGDRAPITEGQSPIGKELRFALYAPTGLEADNLISQFPNLLEPKPRTPFDERGLWIVRPDGYVGLAAANNDWAAAAEYLQRFS